MTVIDVGPERGFSALDQLCVIALACEAGVRHRIYGLACSDLDAGSAFQARRLRRRPQRSVERGFVRQDRADRRPMVKEIHGIMRENTWLPAHKPPYSAPRQYILRACSHPGPCFDIGGEEMLAKISAGLTMSRSPWSADCPALQWLKRVFAAGSLLSLASCVSIDFGEAEMFESRPGPGLSPEAAAGAGYQFEQLNLTASDGIHLRGGLLKRSGAVFTVIFYGGNIATAARTGLRRAREMSPLNVNMVLVDYRSYGGSDAGPMSTEAFLQDGLTLYDSLAARSDIGAERLIVHGHSMGSLIAGHVASNRPTAGVVLESSATTTQAFADRQIPWYGRPFVRVNVAPELREQGNLRLMERIDEPLLILVGQKDRDTPPSFSRQLYEASLPQNRRRLIIIPDAGHSDLFSRPATIEAYREFLASLEPPASDH